jgi:flagellar biosynthetic protein FliQ
MEESLFLEIFQQFIVLVLKMAAPVLLVAVIVGLMVSVIQSVTQIQEQTLTFVPKIFAGIIVLIIAMPWMVETFVTGVNAMFDYLPTFLRQ